MAFVHRQAWGLDAQGPVQGQGQKAEHRGVRQLVQGRREHETRRVGGPAAQPEDGSRGGEGEEPGDAETHAPSNHGAGAS
ncbi:hypothetical protein GALL_525590 [mine drainage metagenome]|uniref:Uncharacterized protein n=1 Tax=mine drainage metagenome TaxID=410659 RepID=A0A1J5PDH8_9ZZZZ